MKQRGREMGFLASVQAFFDMSREWYASRMDEDWEPPTPQEAMALWARHGFVGEYWRLDY